MSHIVTPKRNWCQWASELCGSALFFRFIFGEFNRNAAVNGGEAFFFCHETKTNQEIIKKMYAITDPRLVKSRLNFA